MRAVVRVAGVVVAASVALPVAYLAVRASLAGPSAILAAWTAPLQVRTLLQTVGLVVGVVAVANLVAIPAAWLVTRTDLPRRRLWATLLAVPLVVPSYVSAFAWVSVLGPRGLVRDALSGLSVERLPELAYGFTGALFALALFTYPYVFLPLVAWLGGDDGAAEESARSLGLGRWLTFFRVTLPKLRAPIVSGSLLVALYTLSDFGAVSITRFNTLTLGVYNAYRGLFDRTGAAVLALQLALVALLLVGFERVARGREARPAPRRGRDATPATLGGWRAPAVAGLAGVCLLSLGVPALAIGTWMTRPGAFVGLEATWLATARSIGVSLLAAAVAVLLALPIAIWSARFPNVVSRWVERVATAGYAMPGLVVALALVFVATRGLPWAYQTLGLLVFAYAARFLPESLGATRNGLVRVARSHEEASRSLGSGRLATWRRVTWPLVRPSVLAGGALVFMTSLKELPATLVLRPIGFETLATEIWSAASENYFAEASVPALTLLVAGAVPVYHFAIRPTLRFR